MVTAESYSEYTNKYIRKFFLPNSVQIVAYITFSLAILTLLSAKDYWSYFIKPLLGSGALDVSAPGGVQKVFGIIAEGRLAQIVFWAVIGIGTYIFVWFIKNVAFNIYNDLIAGHYVHPNYTKNSYWRGIIFQKVFFVGALVTLIIYLVTLLRLLPILAKQLYFAVTDFRLIHSVFVAFAVVLGVAILLYLLFILTRITLHALVLIYKGL